MVFFICKLYCPAHSSCLQSMQTTVKKFLRSFSYSFLSCFGRNSI